MRSHVIPEFLYQVIYDSQHRALKLTASTGRATPVQVGFRAPILGKGCESYINDEFEQPFRRVWFEPGRAPTVARGDFHNIQVPNYGRFKLFLLSVLFRAGICPVGPYAGVKLGAHEGNLREMLLKGDPKSANEYPIVGSLLLMPGSIDVCTLVAPAFEITWNAEPAYVFAFGGCLWHFPLTTSGAGEPFTAIALQEDGRMSFRAVDLWRVTPLRHAFEVHAAQANRRQRKKR